MSTVLVTGGSRGIGLALARAYVRRSWTVFATCRRRSAELDRSGARVIEGIDVAKGDLSPLSRAVAGTGPIDLLVHSAGVLYPDRLDALEPDRMREQFEVNALGLLRVTSALLDHLSPGCKVVVLSSEMGSKGGARSGGDYGYRLSKAAANMAVVCLAHDLRSRGITVVAVHPGWVRTEMTALQGDWEAEDAAERLVRCADRVDPSMSGRFLDSGGAELPW